MSTAVGVSMVSSLHRISVPAVLNHGLLLCYTGLHGSIIESVRHTEAVSRCFYDAAVGVRAAVRVCQYLFLARPYQDGRVSGRVA